MFYHGSKHKIEKFSDEFVGGQDAKDQEGPGIYFSSSWDDARGYGEYVYTVTLNPRKEIPNKKGKVPIKELEWLIKNAPYWEDTVQNWDENINIGLKKSLQAILQSFSQESQQTSVVG